MNQDELPGYVSSAPDFAPIDTPKPIDEAEIGTIVQLFDLIQKQKSVYESTASIDLTEEMFTVKEQLYLNAESLSRLQAQESLLLSTINKVKEKQNGRQY